MPSSPPTAESTSPATASAAPSAAPPASDSILSMTPAKRKLEASSSPAANTAATNAAATVAAPLPPTAAPASSATSAPSAPVSAPAAVGLKITPTTGVVKTLDAHLRALLALLQQYDQDVDVLTTPLTPSTHRPPSSTSSVVNNDGGPASKRPRLDSNGAEESGQATGDADTIESRIQASQYASFQAFLNDLDAASARAIARRRALEGDSSAQSQSQPHPQTQQQRATSPTSLQGVINRTRILRKHVDNYVARNPMPEAERQGRDGRPQEQHQQQASSPAISGSAVKKEPSVSSQGKQTPTPEEHKPFSHFPSRPDSTVLTLAAHGKQLFSSLRKPHSSAPRSTSSPHQSPKATIKEELALPAGISFTQVIPYNPAISQSSSKRRGGGTATSTTTFADTFPPKPQLPALDPPVGPPARPAVVPWIDRYEVAVNACIRPEERTGFLYYPMPSGRWIQYGYSDVVEETLRKSQTLAAPHAGPDGHARPRLYGTGPFGCRRGGKGGSTAEDALFANVYSSFAPSFESAGALVGREERDRIWWETTGVGKMLQALELAEESGAAQSDASAATNVAESQKKSEVDPEMIDEALLQEAISSREKEEKSGQEKQKDAPAAAAELDELLAEISELIHTLNSYRQLRNLCPPRPANDQPTASATQRAPPPAAATPSPEEILTYETLKSSLAAMVGTLPPYAVAKLDSDQLAELGVTAPLIVEGPNYPGTMEEDEHTQQQRQYRATQPQAASQGQIPPQAAVSMGRGASSRSTMAYQSAASTTANTINYQRPSYAASSRAARSTAPPYATAPAHQQPQPQPQPQPQTSPQRYSSASRGQASRSTYLPHVQAPYAPGPLPMSAVASTYAPQAAGVPYQPRGGGVSTGAAPAMPLANGVYIPPSQQPPPVTPTLPSQRILPSAPSTLMSQPGPMHPRGAPPPASPAAPIPNPAAAYYNPTATPTMPPAPASATSPIVPPYQMNSPAPVSQIPLHIPVATAAAQQAQQQRYYAQQQQQASTAKGMAMGMGMGAPAGMGMSMARPMGPYNPSPGYAPQQPPAPTPSAAMMGSPAAVLPGPAPMLPSQQQGMEYAPQHPQQQQVNGGVGGR
ncbi:hypothetical protein KEM52_002212 [Ascosphaera acerosa]|nr:hypothetical protein KEM52_002212 [Ascosphaera acerosa]